MSDIILKARNVVRHFDTGGGVFAKKGIVRAVDGVSFDVIRGETLAVVGESGCGKSTLGRLIMRLIELTSGEVIYNGRDISKLSDSEMRPLRREMQMVFQDPFASLNPRMTVGDIVGEPLWLAGESSRARRARVKEILESVGLRQEQAERYPHEFSGGQRQRIGIARAIAGSPKLLLGDEPVSALDVSVQAQIVNLLEELKEKLQLTLIIIAHDLAVIRHMSDRVIVMYLGEAVEIAKTDDLYSAPRHPYTRALMSAIPIPAPGGAPRERQLLQGDVPNPARPPSGCRFHTRCPFAQAVCREKRPVLEMGEDGRQVACHFWRDLPAEEGLAQRAPKDSAAKAKRLEIYAKARAVKA